MARRGTDFELRGGRPGRSAAARSLLIALFVAVFLIVPLVITHSIIFVDPNEAIVVLALIGLITLILVPLHDKPINTRPFLVGLMIYIVCYFVWPNWAAIQVPFLPFITPGRVVLLVLMLSWMFVVATSRAIHARLWQRLRTSWPFCATFGALLLLRALSVATSVDPSQSMKDFVDECISYYLPLMIAVTIVESERDIFLLIKVAVAASIVDAVMVIPEWITQQNPLVKYLGHYLDYSGRWLDMVFETENRMGRFRAQGPFMEPLQMGEYFALMFPFFLYWLEKAKSIGLRLFLFAGLGLAMFALYASDSRTGMLCCGGALGLYLTLRGFLFALHNPKSRAQPLAIFFVACVGVLVLPALYYAYRHMHWYSAFGALGSRTLQLAMGIPKVLARPLGYGSGLAGLVLGDRSNGRDLTIDNYYLSIALDIGIPGLIAYVGGVLYLLYSSLRNLLRPGPEASLYLCFFLFYTVFALDRWTIAEPQNLTLFFLMTSGFMALHALTTQQRQHAAAAAEPGIGGGRKRRRRRAWRLTGAIEGG